MIIAIDLTLLSWHLSGVERYAMCMTDKMIDLDCNNNYVLIFRNDIFPLYKNRIDGNRIKAEVLKGENKLFFLQITLLKALRKIKADKYIFFAFPSPILFKSKGIINTIHDMGAWDFADAMTIRSKYYFRVSYHHCAKISERIITVSEFSKRRIHKILSVPKEKIEVISSAVYEGILEDKKVPFEIVKSEYDLPDKFILTLSTIEPRKNLKLLLDVYNDISIKVDYDLVLVGRKGWKIDNLIEQYSAKGRIHITGFVKDEHLSTIYKNALCFVFPSFYEGFGLPPVEALALGTPVVSSDAAALPEVLMDQAVYFKNNSPGELREILNNLEENLKNIPNCLNSIQKKKYRFEYAAKKVIELIKIEAEK